MNQFFSLINSVLQDVICTFKITLSWTAMGSIPSAIFSVSDKFADQETKTIAHNYTHQIHHALYFAFPAPAKEDLDRRFIEKT